MPVGVPLDADEILTATEAVIRRHGPAKATVLDVARSLGVSHTAVYNHFASKAALREAVIRRWLSRGGERLAAIAEDDAVPPPDRLRAWLAALLDHKRARAEGDPELFAAFLVLAGEGSAAATEHVADLLTQLQAIVAAGIERGDFRTTDPVAAAHTVFAATTGFHHPAHARSWQSPDIDAELDAVCTVLLQGL